MILAVKSGFIFTFIIRGLVFIFTFIIKGLIFIFTFDRHNNGHECLQYKWNL